MNQQVTEANQQPAQELSDGSAEIELAVIPARLNDIFGYGINCITGDVSASSCVSNIQKHSVPDNDSHVLLKVVKDSETYSEFVNLAIKVDVSGLAWSTSESVSWSVSHSGSDTYMSYLAFNQARTQRIYLGLTEAKIADEAIALITSDPANGPAKFLDTYGTHCVIGVAYGASFVGQLRFEAHSASDKESIVASMSASAAAFGGSGSVDAQFTSEKSTIKVWSSFTSDSLLKGGTVTGSRTDPDGIVACANSLAAKDGIGDPIGFRCITWDQFPQIKAALKSINRPEALSLASAAGNLLKLSFEYIDLDYVMNTCANMIKSKAYAIPSYGATLDRMYQAAATGRSEIRKLTIERIEKLTPTELARYLIAAQIKPLLDAISHNQVLVEASWYLDAAFKTPGSFSKTCAASFSNDLVRVAEVDHGYEHPAALYFHVGQDGAGSYLVARWDWEYEQHWDGARVDIGTASFPTGVSRAEWQGANWNNISVRLTDFNPTSLYGRA